MFNPFKKAKPNFEQILFEAAKELESAVIEIVGGSSEIAMSVYGAPMNYVEVCLFVAAAVKSIGVVLIHPSESSKDTAIENSIQRYFKTVADRMKKSPSDVAANFPARYRTYRMLIDRTFAQKDTTAAAELGVVLYSNTFCAAYKPGAAIGPGLLGYVFQTTMNTRGKITNAYA